VGEFFDNPSVKYRRHTIAGAESIDVYALEAPPALCAILVPWVVLTTNRNVSCRASTRRQRRRSVLHSGTVGAILTGAQLGLSGLAVSVQWGDDVHYTPPLPSRSKSCKNS